MKRSSRWKDELTRPIRRRGGEPTPWAMKIEICFIALLMAIGYIEPIIRLIARLSR
ncbi:MAG: hypothetical protein U5M50_04165 [Sphingobium sp.]|nr:hypothetical protein [Sphingobium sp.]